MDGRLVNAPFYSPNQFSSWSRLFASFIIKTPFPEVSDTYLSKVRIPSTWYRGFWKCLYYKKNRVAEVSYKLERGMFPTHRPVTPYMCHFRAFRSLSSELKCGQLGRLRQRRQGATLLVPTAATCSPRTKACRNSACTAPSSHAVNGWSCQSCKGCQRLD